MSHVVQSGFYLGIDAGGTKTKAVIARDDGIILGQGISGGANLHNLAIEIVFHNINDALAMAIDQVKNQHPDIHIVEFESVCLGLAGFDTPQDRTELSQFLKTFGKHHPFSLPIHRLMVTNDGLIGLYSGTTSHWGISLVASTGSNCYGLYKSGQEFKAGDWGYLLGDQASGYVMGKKILELVMKEFDGRHQKTSITPKVLDYLKLNNPEALIKWVYQTPTPVREIAALSHLVNDPSLINDPSIVEVINSAVSELVEAYAAVVSQLALNSNDVIPAVLIGGLFKHLSTFTTKIESKLKQLTPHANLIFPTRNPAEGALLLALLPVGSVSLPDTIYLST
jgi:N-acetylglucosamine kinase-like BadF-type ATPase